MPLNEKSRKQIEKILMKKLQSKITEYKEADDMEKPFYFSLFSEENVYLASMLQSIYTWFGSQWEIIGKIIAENNLEKFSTAETHYMLEGKITKEEESAIGKILRELDRKKSRRTNIIDEKEEISQSYDRHDLTEIYNEEIDLFTKTNDGREIYFELKSVKPNKNEIRAAKNDLLHVLAMRQKEKDIDKVDIFLALPYNQYVGKYDRWTVLKFFSFNNDLLVGKDFWDFLGGENTYEDLLKLFSDVGDEIKDSLEEAIQYSHQRKKYNDTTMEDF